MKSPFFSVSLKKFRVHSLFIYFQLHHRRRHTYDDGMMERRWGAWKKCDYDFTRHVNMKLKGNVHCVEVDEGLSRGTFFREHSRRNLTSFIIRGWPYLFQNPIRFKSNLKNFFIKKISRVLLLKNFHRKIFLKKFLKIFYNKSLVTQQLPCNLTLDQRRCTNNRAEKKWLSAV